MDAGYKDKAGGLVPRKSGMALVRNFPFPPLLPTSTFPFFWVGLYNFFAKEASGRKEEGEGGERGEPSFSLSSSGSIYKNEKEGSLHAIRSPKAGEKEAFPAEFSMNGNESSGDFSSPSSRG